MAANGAVQQVRIRLVPAVCHIVKRSRNTSAVTLPTQQSLLFPNISHFPTVLRLLPHSLVVANNRQLACIANQRLYCLNPVSSLLRHDVLLYIKIVVTSL